MCSAPGAMVLGTGGFYTAVLNDLYIGNDTGAGDLAPADSEPSHQRTSLNDVSLRTRPVKEEEEDEVLQEDVNDGLKQLAIVACMSDERQCSNGVVAAAGTNGVCIKRPYLREEEDVAMSINNTRQQQQHGDKMAAVGGGKVVSLSAMTSSHQAPLLPPRVTSQPQEGEGEKDEEGEGESEISDEEMQGFRRRAYSASAMHSYARPFPHPPPPSMRQQCTTSSLTAADREAAMTLSRMACFVSPTQCAPQRMTTGGSTSGGRRRHMSLPDRVRRPMNRFMIFAQQKRPELSQRYPSMDNRQISQLLGQLWASMPESEKRPYSVQARVKAEEIKRRHPDCWKRKRSASASQ